MELMDGYVKEGGNVGVDDPGRWSSKALDFLSATTSVSSAKELLQVWPYATHLTSSDLPQHPFLHSWQMQRLQGFVSLVTTWTKQSYRYLGWEEAATMENGE